MNPPVDHFKEFNKFRQMILADFKKMMSEARLQESQR